MKRKWNYIGIAVCILILGVSYMMPRMVESSIPSAYYVTPSVSTYENIINCTGTVQADKVQSIYLENAVVVEELYVEIGSYVQEGDLLLKVDEQKTKSIFGGRMSEMDGSVREEASIPQSASIDWAALASMYGLSSVVNGSGEVDYGQLEQIIDTGANLAGDAVSVPVDGEVEQYVYAPLSGIVTDLGVQEGVPAGAGKSLLTISDTQSYKVMATVGEADIAKIKVGDTATVRGVAFSGRAYAGTVTKIYPTARKMLSGTSTETVVDVEISLHRGDDHLKSGFSAKVEIAGDEDYNLLTVPYEAIRQDDNNDEYVYVYQDGKLQKSLIVTGKELTNEVQILSGLSEDSIVVFNPGSGIQEGSMIYLKGRADVN